MKRFKEILIVAIFLGVTQVALFLILLLSTTKEINRIVMVVYMVIWTIIFLGLWFYDKSLMKKYSSKKVGLSEKDKLLIAMDFKKDDSTQQKEISFKQLLAVRKKNSLGNMGISILGIIFAVGLYLFTYL